MLDKEKRQAKATEDEQESDEEFVKMSTITEYGQEGKIYSLISLG
jgi:hypothetical protein